MDNILHRILAWSEVWALLIPLTILVWKKDRTPYLRPVRIYLWVTLVLNIGIDLISNFKKEWGLKQGDFFWNNNFIYNIHSVFRFLMFAWFFNLLRQRFMHRVKIIIAFAFLAFVLVNFIFFENFIPRNMEIFSSRLLSTEAALLLFYCLQYFIYLMIEDKTTGVSRQRGFWVVTGLSIYVAVNFFIFLFYSYLSDVKRGFATNIWDVHNIVFILLCILIAKQFYQKNE